MISNAQFDAVDGLKGKTLLGTLRLYALTVFAVIPAGLVIGWSVNTAAAFKAAPFLVGFFVMLINSARFSPHCGHAVSRLLRFFTRRDSALVLACGFCLILVGIIILGIFHQLRQIEEIRHTLSLGNRQAMPADPESQKREDAWVKERIRISIERLNHIPRRTSSEVPIEAADPEKVRPHEVTRPEPKVLPSGAAYVQIADGFDFPVGKPDGLGYQKVRGFTPNGHLGEDWKLNGATGNMGVGSPVYSTAAGVVVLAANVQLGWGNVVIVRHSYCDPAENNSPKTIDSLYGHLDTFLVQKGQILTRGQLLGTMGTAGGLYDAHLHFEIRKNIHIGMSRSAYARDFSNYEDPTQFIGTHRKLRAVGNPLITLDVPLTPDSSVSVLRDRGNMMNHSLPQFASSHSPKVNDKEDGIDLASHLLNELKGNE